MTLHALHLSLSHARMRVPTGYFYLNKQVKGMLNNYKGHVELVCTLTVSVNKNQNYAAYNNNLPKPSRTLLYCHEQLKQLGGRQ